jgi:carboxymethylenebutenolidase
MKFLSLFVLSLSVFVLSVRAAGEDKSFPEKGSFVTLKQGDGGEFRAFVAGPADAKAGVLFVHDYFGISDATEQSVERLAALGYRSVAVDLYGGKSATSNDEAAKLMRSLGETTSSKILQAGLDYLKQPGRKLATIGFSMGGQESLNANLNDPEAVSASVIVYGSGFDKIDPKRLERLKSPVLVSAGAEDSSAVQAAINFLSTMKEAKRPCEMLVYPGADHGYAQPLFLKRGNFACLLRRTDRTIACERKFLGRPDYRRRDRAQAETCGGARSCGWDARSVAGRDFHRNCRDGSR